MAARRRTAGPEIIVQNPNRYPGVDSARIRAWLERLVAELAPAAGSLAVRLVGDRAMRDLNRRFRGRPHTTDVLSFPGAPSPEAEHLGDIAVSVPVARAQAAAAGHHLEREVRRLLLHGVLHCLGHDHETDGGRMRRLESRLRRRWVDDDA